jgi:hypothetical protein
MVAALDAPVAVGRDERQRTGSGPFDRLDDHVCRLFGELPQSAVFPCSDERAHRSAVGDGGTRGGEREPAARALEAALDGPRGGRAAAGTARTAQPGEARETRRAERGSEPAAGGAAAGNEEVEQHILRPYVEEMHVSVPRVRQQ